jgi:hypothetical protein
LTPQSGKPMRIDSSYTGHCTFDLKYLLRRKSQLLT